MSTHPSHRTGGATTTEDAKPVHPYKDKLATFKPNDWQLKKQIALAPAPLEDDTYTFVDSVSSLNEMMVELRKVKEVAISVQFERSTHFHPTCRLLEISTRNHDYIIDAMTLKEEVKVINEITSDESILKVFYGTGNTVSETPKDKYRQQGDMEIMATRMGLWVVNLFDIISALRLSTGKEVKNGNGYFTELLKKHCFVDFKTLGRPNVWDERPLSEDQIQFLRMKVHYLLYIQDVYRNELVDSGRIDELYCQCTNLCKTSNTPAPGPGSHISLYKSIYKKEKGDTAFNHRQMECFRLLFNWRYKTAKENDKGLVYVLMTKNMFKVAKELPRKVERVAKCFPNEVLPPLVEANLRTFHGLILQAYREVTDLTKIRVADLSEVNMNSSTGFPSKRSSSSNQNQNSNAAKRVRGGFQLGPLKGDEHMNSGPDPMRGHGHINSGPGPMRGRGHMNSGPGPIRGRGHMNAGPGPMRGRGTPPQPWMHSAVGRGVGSQKSVGRSQSMGLMIDEISHRWGHDTGSSRQQMGASAAMEVPGFLDEVLDEVVGEVAQRLTQQATGHGNNMYGGIMNSQERGGPRGGRGGSRGRGYGRR